MCECLSYDDGSMHLCEVCAGIVRECPHCARPVMGKKATPPTGAERLMHLEFWVPIPDELNGDRLFDYYCDITSGVGWFLTERVGLPAHDFMASACIEDFDGHRLEWNMEDENETSSPAPTDPAPASEPS